jgi:hypothetical protein
MRKTPVTRRRRPLPPGPGLVASAGVSIASGANIPRIDLETLFRQGQNADSVAAVSFAAPTGTAMTGGGVQSPAALPTDTTAPTLTPRSRTVALQDGTRITFAAADWVYSLETA